MLVGEAGMQRAAVWVVLVGGLVASLGHSRVATAEQVVLRLGTVAPDGSPYLEGTREGDTLVGRNSQGKVRLKVFHSGMMGDEAQLIDSLARGKIDMFAGSAAAAQPILPELSVFELPFLFRNSAEVDAVLPRVMPRLRKVAATRGYGVASYMVVGFRHLGVPRPLRTIEDLRALKMRSQPGPLHERMWTLLGVKHKAMGVADVLAALESKQVEAFDGALVWVFASAWHQHMKQLVLSGHIYQPGIMLINAAGLAKIPASLRANIFDGGEKMGVTASRKVREVEQGLLEALSGFGVQVVPVPPALRDEMERLTAPMRGEWRKSASPEGRKLLDDIERELARLRQKT
jgi:TRAP-type C4-dicarboxylate transport system substrate-binding protein